MEAAATQAQVSETQRAMEICWCKCRHCQAMPTEVESFCCVDWDMAMPLLESLDNSAGETMSAAHCLTEDPDFPSLLNHAVLEMVFHLPKVKWKRRPRPEGPSGTLSVE